MAVNSLQWNYGVQEQKQVQKPANKSHSFSDALNKAMQGQTKSLEEIFDAAAEKYQIPVKLLKAIAKAESNFNSNAVSSAGAQGVMQLMPATARSLGVHDAFDAEQNIMGGAKYISQMLERFNGNITLALAAYNAGPGNVMKYDGMPPFKETQNYVKKVLGYMGESIYAPGTVSTKNAQPIMNDTALNSLNAVNGVNGLDASTLMMQSINMMFSNQKGFNGMGYEMMLSLYQYQVQAKLLANVNMDDIL